MSRFVPVSFEKWAEMVKAQSDLVRYKEMCDELDAECTRLKAENEKYRRCFQAEGDWVLMEPSEHALLKAEVERLTPLLGDIVSFDEYFKLLQQVERLTKAGDAMASTLKDGGIIISGYALADEWFKAKCLAAKEGKQP